MSFAAQRRLAFGSTPQGASWRVDEYTSALVAAT
jgi:hypothetical protein